jgi:hypothetical protein
MTGGGSHSRGRPPNRSRDRFRVHSPRTLPRAVPTLWFIAPPEDETTCALRDGAWIVSEISGVGKCVGYD